MWELRNEQANRVFNTTIGCFEKKCPVCGQYFQSKEQYYLVICNAIPEARKRKLTNLMVHTSCWDTFCEGITDDETLAVKLAKHRPPKAQPYTEQQKRYAEAFFEAAKSNGFAEQSNGKDCVRAKRHGSSMTLTYNVRSNTIRYSDRCTKRGMFDGLFIRQIEVNVFNDMHKLLGDSKQDDYSVEKIMNDVTTSVNEMFK